MSRHNLRLSSRPAKQQINGNADRRLGLKLVGEGQTLNAVTTAALPVGADTPKTQGGHVPALELSAGHRRLPSAHISLLETRVLYAYRTAGALVGVVASEFVRVRPSASNSLLCPERLRAGMFVGTIHLWFLVRRICRVYLPFAGSILLSLVAYNLVRPTNIDGLSYWFNNLAWKEAPTSGLVARHLLMTGLNGDDSLNPVMWSLVYELRISLIFPVLFAATYRHPSVMLLGAIVVHFAVALLIGCRSLQCTPYRGDTLAQSFALTGYFVVFFVAGIVLAKHRGKLVLSSVPRVATSALSVLGIYCLILPNVGLVGGRLPADLTFGFGAMLLITLAVGSPTWGHVLKHAALTRLGRISYSLYLTHNIMLLLAVHAFHGTVYRLALIILIVGLSLVTAEANYRLIECPSLKLGRQLARYSPGVVRVVKVGRENGERRGGLERRNGGER